MFGLIKKHKNKLVITVLVLFVAVLLLLHGDSADPVTVTDEEGYLTRYSAETNGFLSEYFVLNPGTYRFTVHYMAESEGNYALFLDNGIEIDKVLLDPTEQSFVYEVKLAQSSPMFRIMAEYAGEGELVFESIEVVPGQPWYHDNWLNVATFLLFVSVLACFSCLYQKGEVWRKRVTEWCIVCGIALVASVLLFSGSPVGHGDDIEFHLTRIEGIAQGLRDGQFPVMIYPDLAKENGYLNAMYPSLFFYFPAVLRLFGVSLQMAYKALLVAINFGTAFVMYGSMKSITRSRKAVFLATILYMFCRYRMNNMFVRCAIGETLAMIFLPLLIAGLYHVIFGDRKKWWMLVVAATGVLQSHVLSTAIYVAIAGVVIVFCLKRIIKEKRFIEIGKVIAFSAGINLFFLVPFIVYTLSGTLNLSALANQEFTDMCLSMASLFGIFRSTSETVDVVRDFALHLSLTCLLGFSVWYMIFQRQHRDDRDYFLRVVLGLAVLFLFGATNWFPYEWLGNFGIMRKLMQFLQFSWRLIGPAVGMLIMAGAIWLAEWEKPVMLKNGIMVALVLLMATEVTQWDLNWENDIYDVNADLYKVNANIMYTPAEYLVGEDQNWLTEYAASNEQILVNAYEKDGLKIHVQYENTAVDGSYMDLPLLHYMGYTAKDENGTICETGTTVSGNIRVYLPVEQGMHELYISYRTPLLFTLSGVLSLLTVIACVYLVLRDKR